MYYVLQVMSAKYTRQRIKVIQFIFHQPWFLWVHTYLLKDKQILKILTKFIRSARFAEISVIIYENVSISVKLQPKIPIYAKNWKFLQRSLVFSATYYWLNHWRNSNAVPNPVYKIKIFE